MSEGVIGWGTSVQPEHAFYEPSRNHGLHSYFDPAKPEVI